MHTSLSTSYILPAIFLNPVLFLHSVNAILARILPPIIIDAAVQPPPYYSRGPSAEHPHINVHASERLCWSYTVFMVCAQLVAFRRVSMHREARRERVRRRKEKAMNGTTKEDGINGSAMYEYEAITSEAKFKSLMWPSYDMSPVQRSESEESSSSTESEVIL